MKGERKKSRAWVVIRLVFSLALLAYVVWAAAWGDVLSTLEHARLANILLLIATTPVSVYVCVVKWRMLLAARGADVPTPRLFGLYVLGAFYSNVLPTSIGGDLVRVTALKPHVPKLEDAFGSVFVERLTGLFALTLLGVAALVAWPGLGSHPLVTGIVYGSVALHLAVVVAIVDRRVLALCRMLFGWLPFAGKAFGRFEGFRAYLDAYRAHPGLLFRCVLLSFVFYGISILNVYLAATGIGDWIALWKCGVASPVSQLVSMLPIAINGIGLTEWALTYSFSTLGASAATGLAAALVIRVRNTLFAVLGYGCLALRGATKL